jgi:hypothetical protein
MTIKFINMPISLIFCSAKLLHLLARANPKNITACPFTISVYELSNDLGKIHIAYQKTMAEPSTEKR